MTSYDPCTSTFLPLFDPRFQKLYQKLGSYGPISFFVNGEIVPLAKVEDTLCLTDVREFFPLAAGKKIGFGIVGLAGTEYPIGTDRCGVMLCTFGKVIRADLFGLFPGRLGPRIVGVVEVRDLIGFLTTSKTDFNRGRGSTYRRFCRLYEPIKQEFSAWLAEFGITPREETPSQQVLKLEKELKRLVQELPELSEFFGMRLRKEILVPNEDGTVCVTASDGIQETYPVGDGRSGASDGAVDSGEIDGLSWSQDVGSPQMPAKPISRSSRLGPRVTLYDAAERVEVAWVESDCVVINVGHPAYKTLTTNSSARHLYHIFAIGVALQRFFAMTDQPPDLGFIDRLLTAWASKQVTDSCALLRSDPRRMRSPHQSRYPTSLHWAVRPKRSCGIGLISTQYQ
jgi:hypothetical protein